jgi:hypothetical protein
MAAAPAVRAKKLSVEHLRYAPRFVLKRRGVERGSAPARSVACGVVGK